jgi:hypothetical protein
MYCIVKSTPTSLLRRALAASSAIPAKPIKPKSTRTDATSGMEPMSPPPSDLKIIVNKIRTKITANRSDKICPLIMDEAKSVIIIA